MLQERENKRQPSNKVIIAVEYTRVSWRQAENRRYENGQGLSSEVEKEGEGEG